MKPNDKAIEAAILAIKENGPYYAGSKIRESMAKHLAEVALPPAYAAQFQSEEYAGLVKELRKVEPDLPGDRTRWYRNPNGPDAADAIEALLAERDELKGVIQSYQILLETQQGMFVAVQAERDALAAHLAPVDDDILREIAAMHFARIDGHSDNWDRYVDEAKDYIDAIRPHIEAAERERCAKIASGLCESCGGEGWLWAHELGIGLRNDDTKYSCDGQGESIACKIAAAIRSGK